MTEQFQPQGFQQFPGQQFAPQAPQFQPQAPAQFAPPQQFAPQAPQFPGQPYGMPQQPQQPAQPLAAGSLDAFNSQPVSTGEDGNSCSWKDLQPGAVYAGTVTRDVVDSDVMQQTDYTTKLPKFSRDGRPMFQMRVPLQLDQCPPQYANNHPDGKGSLWVLGKLQAALVQAMGAAGVSGAPKKGDHVVVTLADRKATSAGSSPAKIFAVQYVPANSAAPAPAPVAQAAPEPQAPAPVPAPVQMPQVPQAPAQAPAQMPQAPQAAAPAPAGVPSAASLTPEQQALLARIGG